MVWELSLWPAEPIFKRNRWGECTVQIWKDKETAISYSRLSIDIIWHNQLRRPLVPLLTGWFIIISFPIGAIFPLFRSSDACNVSSR